MLNEKKMVKVAVGVIIRDQKILLSKRPDHLHQGGLWEFPGGKIENNETVEDALGRELAEELGVQVIRSESLMDVKHDYIDKSVLLQVHMVRHFIGGPTEADTLGEEGQLVRWVPIEELDHYEFPAANQSILMAIKNSSLS
ncbi:8-oxo-dGTP diphosphatase MutT [Marinibactrum halimedae]|uniref:8-oxo-dGTP diphosphatase n=1 Tax=Marinibactrum halimedae TaxID=1444977 RepID=A0AA37WP33_9GAMM|nr:8-oxo-dGTP diphosphatase MutT [Marinibactrum halimedae]MCD9459615.1 8-oxo-dGTP diphosphatase MutT [Marinibactrum halimedae]GLS25567.1 7,8-dihydro-8-oxoguanine-triphosphatase [Marinibactrum halimedae]